MRVGGLAGQGCRYRSSAFKTAFDEDISHKHTRPFRPQTNGKVERFNRTMLEGCACARTYTSEAERVADLPGQNI